MPKASFNSGDSHHSLSKFMQERASCSLLLIEIRKVTIIRELLEIFLILNFYLATTFQNWLQLVLEAKKMISMIHQFIIPVKDTKTK